MRKRGIRGLDPATVGRAAGKEVGGRTAPHGPDGCGWVVGEIMSSGVIAVEPEALLRDVVDRLSKDGISGAPVVSGSRVVGVISMTDILDYLASTPGVPADRPTQLEWGGWEEEVLLPEDEEPSAYFSDFWSDVGAEALERFEEQCSAEWDRLAEHTAAEIMTRRILCVPPDAPVQEAARIMAGTGAHRLLVMEGERLVGVVTSMDFLRAIAESGGRPLPSS